MATDNIISRSDAAALIPHETSNDIIQMMPKSSVTLSLFKQMRMSSKTKSMPVVSALPMAFFVNGDTGLKQTTEVNWDNKNLVAEELACIVPIPEAVLDDSEFDIWGEIKPLIASAMGAAVDGATLFGINKPASWGLSIAEMAAAGGNSFTRGSVAGQKIDLDINAVMSLVEDDGFDVNFYAARKSIKGALRGLRTNDGALLFQPTLQAGTPDTLYGESIMYVQNGGWDNTKADLVCGDSQLGIFATRQDITYKILTEAVIQDAQGNIIYNLAQQDMVAMRVVFRGAWQTANVANAQNQVAANRAPFGVLRPIGFVA